MIELKRKDGESVNAFLYRFYKRVRQSGLMKEAKRRRFYSARPNKRARRDSTLYRIEKHKEMERLRKLGKL